MTKGNNKEVEIPVSGSLGILAFGDIGLKSWRKVRDAAKEKRKAEAKKQNDKNDTENE